MASQSERLGQIALERYSTAPLFNTKAVVRQTGIPAPTLRAWERRYDILTPQRGSNDYRLYSERDIALVCWLRQQVENGMNISQAIALLHSAPLPVQPQHIAARMQASGSVTTSPSSLADELLEACARLDEMAAQSVLASLFTIFSVEQAIADILQPMLITVGERWQAGQLSVTTEHFAITLIRSRLFALLYAQPVPASGPLVLVGCAPEEQHELGALMLALLLRCQRSGLRVIYLGQNLEPAHLIETIQLQRPAVICLSASLVEHRPGIADMSRRMSALSPFQRPLLVYGGQAFAQAVDEIEGFFLGTQATQAVAPIERFCATRPLVLS